MLQCHTPALLDLLESTAAMDEEQLKVVSARYAEHMDSHVQGREYITFAVSSLCTCTLPAGLLLDSGRFTVQRTLYSTQLYIVNRPGVAGAVLQSPSSLIYSFIH